MEPDVIVLEDASTGEWGLSTGGSNPDSCDYVPCKTQEEAWNIKRAYDSGDIMPFLNAAMRTREAPTP
jgi:hypothetical protein